MGGRVVKGSASYKLAESQFKEWLGDQKRVTLGNATRALDKADFNRFAAEVSEKGVAAATGPLGCAINIGLVSRLLRAQGFRKVGYEGSGYDREPVYTRAGGVL